MEHTSKKRVKINISGIVQGVGFRPFVYNLAQKYSLCGYVLNNGGGVVVEVEGGSVALLKFQQELEFHAPSLSRIDKLTSFNIPNIGEDTFSIIDSSSTDINTMISADISICDDCKKELFNPKNRRYKYPFINCTNCGPRYTIIKFLPYDRKNSSMSKFEMCDACRAEYEDPKSRRFHAQAISCYDCGVKLSISGLMQEDKTQENDLIQEFSNAIREGKSVALKGIGGFHIVCDATNEQAIKRLRKNKHRPTKPLAVMFKDIRAIKKVCSITQREEALILSKERPIVLVSKKDVKGLASNIAPNIDKIGVFLAYTPLHELLLSSLKSPIVATSANKSGEPIIKDEKELFDKLPLVVQSALTNDREIVNACDDSVVMSVEDETVMLRLSRGFAPQNFFISKKNSKKILALGANQKSTITIAFENNLILSAHIGDLDSLESFEYFLRTLETFKKFYNFKPDIIVYDKHPKYETTIWAKKYLQKNPNIKSLEVQHHYAHALACMAEYNLEEEVLAFCFDGTGYGDDGTLWGGEVLKATPSNYKRVCNLQTFSLLGADKAVREPRRIALALLFENFTFKEISEMDNSVLTSFSEDELKTYYLMYTKKINSPRSSSMGRLFDGVYALSGHLRDLGYEGESGMIMEVQAQSFQTDASYSYRIYKGSIEIKEMLLEIVNEKDKKFIATKFLNTLVKIIVQISQKHKNLPVILAGGVFQNKVLLQKVIRTFKENSIKYYIQNQTPINDGGISLGQAYHALHKIK